MATVTIEVGSINERDVTTKFGPKKAYDIIASDGTKYQFGFTDPKRAGANVGATITGEATAGKYGMSLDPKTVRTGGSPEEVAATSASPAVVGAKREFKEKVFPVPPTHGDMAIIRQNALTNAVATVADFVATQQAEKWPDLNKWGDMVIEVAYKYAKFSSGHREMEAIGALQQIGVEATAIHTAVEKSLGEAA